MKKIVDNMNYVVNDVSLVHSLRKQIFERKIEIFKSPYVRDIINSIFQTPSMPPMAISVCHDGIITKAFDSESHTYHPIGETVFCPDGALFDYEFCCALCLIIQDIYPKAYKMSTASTQEIAEALQLGQWNISLTLDKNLLHQPVYPAFDINEISNIPLDQLPIQQSDPKEKKFKVFAPISIVLSMLSIILSQSVFAPFFALIAFIIARISIKTVKNKGLSIIAIIFSIIAILLPFYFIFMKINNFFN